MSTDSFCRQLHTRLNDQKRVNFYKTLFRNSQFPSSKTASFLKQLSISTNIHKSVYKSNKGYSVWYALSNNSNAGNIERKHLYMICLWLCSLTLGNNTVT